MNKFEVKKDDCFGLVEICNENYEQIPWKIIEKL